MIEWFREKNVRSHESIYEDVTSQNTLKLLILRVFENI